MCGSYIIFVNRQFNDSMIAYNMFKEKCEE